jgi:uncharacterized protein DUF6526
MAETQSLKSHTMWDPPFHFFLGPVGFILLILSIVDVVRNPSPRAGIYVLVMLWLNVLVFKTRTYSLKVQDRLIRLEERLRLAAILPPALQPRIGELSVDQLIGLRFACDAELPGLVEKCLGGNWNRKQIKEGIKTWKPDTWRV